MNIGIILTALAHGAVAANYLEVVRIVKEGGKIAFTELFDQIGKRSFRVRARVVVNATGNFVDKIRHMDDPGLKPLVTGSRGMHFILNKSFTPEEKGILLPHTDDGRVLFLLPWHGATLVGTTDIPCPSSHSSVATAKELEYLLDHVNRFFSTAVTESDILSAWSGVRPLLQHDNTDNTSQIVRDHYVEPLSSGLITIAGGKWTTYRRMAEDTLDIAVEKYGLNGGPCQTKNTDIIGGDQRTDSSLRLVEGYSYTEDDVRYALQNEYACTPLDILARRMRLAFVHYKRSMEVLPRIVGIMAEHFGWDPDLAKEKEHTAIEELKRFTIHR